MFKSLYFRSAFIFLTGLFSLLTLVSLTHATTFMPLSITAGGPAKAIGRIPITTWKNQRDAGITKQDKDFSCGAASLATLLNSFYGQTVTEEALLQAMNKTDARASFEDMQKALPQFGFKAQGLALSYSQLSQLTRPVVVYVKFRNNAHFSVLRGINADTVWLADPSLGNRSYSREQFLAMWDLRLNEADTDSHADRVEQGRILVVLPISSSDGVVANWEAFSKTPLRQSAAAIPRTRFWMTLF